jgi:hypothetical protein
LGDLVHNSPSHTMIATHPVLDVQRSAHAWSEHRARDVCVQRGNLKSPDSRAY